MYTHSVKRLLAFVLALVMVLGMVPVSGTASGLVWHETDLQIQPDQSHRLVTDTASADHAPTDTVRVSIVLEDPSTVEAGFATGSIANDQKAIAYDRNLNSIQKTMEKNISAQALAGKALDVVWNLTLVANIISANVPYGSLEAIRAVPGVREVRLEQQYSPETVQTQSAASGSMTGAAQLWESGYTGAGSRVAIVDTGTDTDHQSFGNSAFVYSLKNNAKEQGVSYERYLESIDLLDTAEISQVLQQLNISERLGNVSADSYYLNEKLPFGANYVDRNLVVDHDHDYQGYHGSHVAGIAAANRYVLKNGIYEDARQTVGVAGAAPDAQIITLKVFGNATGPYDSDYFAAIEDAIWLGCDSVNLSLGTGKPGSSYNEVFADLLEFLETTDTVVVMSAGNSGNWAAWTPGGYLYPDSGAFQTTGEPGTYTNALSVASVDNDAGGQQQSNSYTISSFSSWGVPGSLKLKPEITAPGGYIKSVNGVDTSGTAYEYMSGTSMAAPQVTGMAAQMAQYIREAELEEQTGLSVRQLTQSLLMSTAVPLRDSANGGSYYSVLAQGSGFARVDLAASAESYVMVEGEHDGKVKAELGEDARRSGAYSFFFTIHNLEDETLAYDLRADLFTQALFQRDGVTYLDTATRDLTAEVIFTGDGQLIESVAGFDCDLNGDGITSAADADHLLEYLVGNETVLHADGDVDGDGRVTSYDAHRLLAGQTGGHVVSVEPGGSVLVEAILILTDETRALLEEYPTGAYIEGYVYAEPADGEGVTHSIPVLGYYGSWTETGMFDVGSWAEYQSGAEERTPYLYNVNGNQGNYVSIQMGDGKEYLFGGNPYVREEEYLPQRNAFNNQRGYSLQSLRFSLVRNAYDTRMILENKDEELWLRSESWGAYGGAYYHQTTGAWMDTQHRLSINLDMKGVAENTELELRLEAAPELYRTYEPVADTYVADWFRLEEGGVFATTFTIDNTAPQVLDIRQEGSTLVVQAKDNQYIAAVALMNAAGTGNLAIVPGNQLTPNTNLEAELDLAGIYGTEFLVAVYDYAQNVTVCEVKLEQTAVRPRFTLASQDTSDWYGLTDSGQQVQITNGVNTALRAAEYVDGYVFRVDSDNRLWVGSNQDLYSFRFLSELDPEKKHNISKFYDLAYSTQDKTLYGTFYSDNNDWATPYLCTIDLYTGQMTVLGEMSADAPFVTVDDSGTFYGVGYGSGWLYTFRADTVTTGKYNQVARLGGYASTVPAPLAWDHETDELFWAQTGDGGTLLFRVDPATAGVELYASLDFKATGLFIAGSTVGSTFDPTDRVTSVKLPQTARVVAGTKLQLTAQVLPWNVRDDGVVWSSGNKNVAAVDENGLVTGISAGTAVITATSRLDSTKKASCTVTVEALNSGLKGLVWDEDGAVQFATFSVDSLPAYRKLADVDVPLATTAYHNGILYAGTIDMSQGLSDLYTVDPGTYQVTKVGGSSVIAYTDLAYGPKLGYLVATYHAHLALVDPTTGEYIGAFDWSRGVAEDLVGITHVGSEYNDYYGAWVDAFLILDRNGNVYSEAIMPYNGGYALFNGPEKGFLRNMGESVSYAFFQGFHFDGSYLYWTRFNEADNIVELRMMDIQGDGATHSLGYFPEGIWPVGGLYTDAQLSTSALSAEFAQMTVEDTCFTADVPVVADGSLNALETDSSAGEDLFGGNYVNVTYDRDTTNGIFRVEYDSKKLSFAGLESGTRGMAIREEDGALEVAFAHGTAVSAGEIIASLSFRALPGVLGGETAVTVTTRELGQDSVTIVERLTLELPLPLNPFEDVEEGRFYYIPVLWAVQNGITYGISDTIFGTDDPCRRSQVVTFLWRAAGCPEPKSTANTFVDVKKGSFYEKAVLWAVENGITVGLDDTHFGPDELCSRAQVVTFLWRSAGKPAAGGTIPFKDVPANKWYAQPVLWAVQNGITQGMTSTEFGTETTCSRAHVVTFLYRTFG